MNYIYSYTNKINGHQYVGQTNNIERRKREHSSNSKNINSTSYNDLFHKKYREYGEDNFIFSILQTVDTKEEADEAEKFWIDKLQTYAGDNNGGYNMTRGGQNPIIYTYLDKIDKIKNDIKQGVSYIELSKKYGISQGQLSNINHGNQYFDANETYPLYNYNKDKEEINQVIELLLNSKLTMKDIASKMKMSYSQIKKINSGILHHNDNLSYPLRIDVKVQIANEIKKMLFDKKTNAEIIASLGVSASTIQRINNGITYIDSNIKYPIR